MRAIIVGYGKMGTLIHKLASEANISIIALCDHNFSKRALAKKDGVVRSHTVTTELLADADVVIDFSSKKDILERIKLYCQSHVPSIVGVTDWEEEKKEAEKIIKKYKGACLASSNFSVGVLLFSQLVRDAARLFNSCDDYFASITETHHLKKKDSPSGTALMLKQCLCKDVPIASIRSGDNPGRHEVAFDSACDSITLTHQAKNRHGFAQGALSACHYIQGKVGFYTFEDILKDILR